VKLKSLSGGGSGSPEAKKLFSVANGTVVRVEPIDNSNLGIQVRIRHQDNYESTYAHMKEIHVTLNQKVSGGQQIGLSDNTGNSFGSHLHLMLKRFGHPYTDESGQLWPFDIQDPSPFLEVFDGVTFQGKPWPGGSPGIPPTQPPVGQSVDVTPYFVPVGQHGLYTVFHFDAGNTQPQQYSKVGDKVIMFKGEGQWFDNKKYQDYEEWAVTNEGVRKFVDTSDSGNGGRDAYDLHGEIWIPQVVNVGSTYKSTPKVTRFNRTNCQIQGEDNTTDFLYIREIVPHWVSPKNSSISFDDVLVIEWRKTSNVNTPPIEVYKFAKNVGYVEWNGAAIGELPQGRAPLSGELSDC